ncbi:MAG: calcium-binding protein [Rhodospirillales bacterium]
MSTITGTNGNDTLNSYNAGDTILGLSGDDTLRGRSGSVYLFGASGNDGLFGSDEDDVLFGGEGDDTLSRIGLGLGDDLFYGAAGDDTIRTGQGNNTAEGGGGNDYIRGGAEDDLLYGGEGHDALIGSDGNDTLFGGDGNDALNGGVVSWMEGGAGDDRFRVDTADAVVRETAAGGFDQLFSEADTYVLPGGEFGYIERAIISSDFIEGVPNGELEGNDYDNILVGSHLGNNRLIGNSGADTLNGQSGRDFMIGGSGDDTFIVDDQGDKVRDRTGGGVDLVRTEVSFTLPSGSGNAFIENLTLRAIAGDIDATGNGLDNSIQGNAKSNELYGLSGDDILRAGKDRDQLFGGEGNDRLLGQAGDDTLWMQTGNLAFGGLDEDQFRFAGDILGDAGSGGTRIRDFNGVSLNAGNGEDKLVFDTGLETGTFAYIGGAAFSGGGNSEARFDGERRLEIDYDGDGSADIGFEIQRLTAADQLTATDFLWL